MPKLEVTIQPAVLDWIMQQSSADEAVFPDIVDTLQAWRTGTAKPTFHKVEEISKKTRIPFGYFLWQGLRWRQTLLPNTGQLAAARLPLQAGTYWIRLTPCLTFKIGWRTSIRKALILYTVNYRLAIGNAGEYRRNKTGSANSRIMQFFHGGNSALNAGRLIHIVFKALIQRVDGKAHPCVWECFDQIDIPQHEIGFGLDAQFDAAAL